MLRDLAVFIAAFIIGCLVGIAIMLPTAAPIHKHDFRYGDYIQVTDGFFRGFRGWVTDEADMPDPRTRGLIETYRVVFDSHFLVTGFQGDLPTAEYLRPNQIEKVQAKPFPESALPAFDVDPSVK